MKYLSNFLSSKLNESNKHYIEIGDEEFNTSFGSKNERVYFTKSELIEILKHLPKEFTFKIAKKQLWFHLKNNKKVYILMDKLDDEWYYVIDHATKMKPNSHIENRMCFYKCDQFEGLIKLLKDKASDLIVESNNYYIPMSNIEWDELFDNGENVLHIEFNKKEIEGIKKCLPNNYDFENNYSNYKDKYYYIIIENKENKGLFVSIDKIDDEWYYVMDNTNRESIHCYKCDQFDGLIKLIKYKIFKNQNISESNNYAPVKYNKTHGYRKKFGNNEINQIEDTIRDLNNKFKIKTNSIEIQAILDIDDVYVDVFRIIIKKYEDDYFLLTFDEMVSDNGELSELSYLYEDDTNNYLCDQIQGIKDLMPKIKKMIDRYAK